MPPANAAPMPSQGRPKDEATLQMIPFESGWSAVCLTFAVVVHVGCAGWVRVRGCVVRSPTQAWVGSGAVTLCTELTNPSMNLVWVLRTAGWEGSFLYIANGLLFAVAWFIPQVLETIHPLAPTLSRSLRPALSPYLPPAVAERLTSWLSEVPPLFSPPGFHRAPGVLSGIRGADDGGSGPR